MSGPPEPAFAEPWHAQVFALTVHLHERGAFTWDAWADTFGAVLREHGLAKELDGGADYFLAWIAALERICTARGLAEPDLLGALKADWERAYLTTPHGASVALD